MGHFLAVLAIIACVAGIVLLDKTNQDRRGSTAAILLIAPIAILGFYLIET